jgi:iron complex outermembrane receptor protein
MKSLKRIQLLIITIIISNNLVAQKTINGIVKDETGITLVGATVLIKGTNSYAIANNDGKFTITQPEKLPFTLQFKFVGYQLKEVVYNEIPKELIEVVLSSNTNLSEIVITARRREETVQTVPIPIAVVGGAQVENTGAFNVNRLKELIPSVQLYSSNPRNTTLNIRGLGSTFGLTNDGIEPGVGFYVDGVYYARPAATALDFVDLEQVEVLRGPQGTLFGKNTTAGAFNIKTRRPSFTPGAKFELSYGNFGYIQAKASVTGPLTKKIAARLSFSGTQRDGLIENVNTGKFVNDINNQGVRTQLLYTPIDNVFITLAGDYSRQRPDGYAQVVAGVVTTKRAAYRQFNQIKADLNYTLPSQNAFDRKIDHDTPWQSGNDLGGVSLNVDAKIGPGTLTSTTAWRFWDWDPSNDRDFTGLQALAKSQAPSEHRNWSQEIRYAGEFSSKLSGVIGVYAIGQNLKTSPYHTEESGKDQWRFVQTSTSALWKTPGLLDGYGIRTTSELITTSAAVFGQIDWEIFKGLHLLSGIRYNYDEKSVDYSRVTYGGLQTTDPALLALKRAVYSNQEFKAKVDDTNFSGQVTLSYKVSERINTFATYSQSFKPVGINLGGLPTINGQVALDLAVVRPEQVVHYELGIKTSPFKNSSFNLTGFNTDIKDYQTLVQAPEIGVNRGYLANAEAVNVRGLELETSVGIKEFISFNGGLSYTEGIYKTFKNAPLPLEEVGSQVSFKDVSGGDLPGISKWAGSVGLELSTKGKFNGNEKGRYFIASDVYARSAFSSNPSPSQYLNVAGYALLNARIGFKAAEGLSFSIWARNVLDKNYFEQLLPAGGSSGQYAGVLGDQRTFGITLRYSL